MPKFSHKLILAALAVSLPLSAHDNEEYDLDSLVGQRMEVMKDFGAANKTLSPMFRGRMDYNIDEVIRRAQYLKEHSGQALLDMFPADSITDDSDSKANIWTDWETFTAYAFDLERAADQLLATAASGVEAASPAMQGVASSCQSCHRKFRK